MVLIQKCEPILYILSVLFPWSNQDLEYRGKAPLTSFQDTYMGLELSQNMAQSYYKCNGSFIFTHKGSYFEGYCTFTPQHILQFESRYLCSQRSNPLAHMKPEETRLDETSKNCLPYFPVPKQLYLCCSWEIPATSLLTGLQWTVFQNILRQPWPLFN